MSALRTLLVGWPQRALLEQDASSAPSGQDGDEAPVKRSAWAATVEGLLEYLRIANDLVSKTSRSG